MNYKFSSPETPGLHTIISPENSDCKVTSIFRLNLLKGEKYILADDKLELNVALISGEINVLNRNNKSSGLQPRDSFYMPSQEVVVIEAVLDSFLFIGGAPCEGYGKYFVRRYDLDIPVAEIHQIHGEQPYERRVFMTINQEVPASRIIAGITYGDSGGWTSWPPHQHSNDLEEVYCYFDIPKPTFALHLSWLTPDGEKTVYPVSTGDCVIIPEGYHPTVGIPGVQSCYFWVMVAHSHGQRSYELAVTDPNFETCPEEVTQL
jgi:5-deoxy-glucuronate isomerase